MDQNEYEKWVKDYRRNFFKNILWGIIVLIMLSIFVPIGLKAKKHLHKFYYEHEK